MTDQVHSCCHPNTAGRTERDDVPSPRADVDEGDAYGAGVSSRPARGRLSEKGQLGWTGQGQVCHGTPRWSFSRKCAEEAGSSEIITGFFSKGSEIVGCAPY